MPKVEQTQKSSLILYDEMLLENADDVDFDAPGLSMSVAGRGAVRFLEHRSMKLVLRHYHRGGLMAPLFGDRYCRTSLNRTRAWREWNLLHAMYRQGLPVPQPVAARVQLSPLAYRADIITRQIPHAQTLTERLTESDLDMEDWHAIGAMLQQFHSQGIFHADLNAHNILCDGEGRWYLIDFDRGRQRMPARRWQHSNLKRLRHSLDKLARTRPNFHFSDANWADLMAGYAAV
jgi:3-deoxy-D-manno-octulosonic acid kinase